MTDEGTPAPEPLPDGPARPAPLPVTPETGDGGGRRRWVPWVVAGVVLLAAICTGSYFAGKWLFDQVPALPDDVSDARFAFGALQQPASAWWAGDQDQDYEASKGSWAVLQYVGDDDVAAVTIVNTTTEESRTLTGYRVVGVERAAPRLWLVADAAKTGADYYSAETTPRVLDYAGDGIDGPPAELFSLRLDDGSDPRADVDARWTHWTGPGGYSASLEIDVNKGGCPGAIRFSSDTTTSLNAWSAKVPTGVVTFEPIGWSPSGRYFAVVSQGRAADVSAIASAQVEAYAKAVVEDPDAFYPEAPLAATGTIVVFDAGNGTVAAQVSVITQVMWPNAASQAAWTTSDTLVYLQAVDPKADPFDQSGRVWGLVPGGEPTIVAEEEEWGPTMTWFAGVDGLGLLLADNSGLSGTSQLWRVEEGGPTQRGLAVGGVTARWAPGRGMLALGDAEDLEDGHAGWKLYLSDERGDGRRTLADVEGPSYGY